MKEYSLLPSCVGRERECANRECKILFTPENAKAKFHCLKCKNREGYLRLIERRAEELKWFKIFLANVKIIENLVALGYEFVTDEILNSHGFVRKVGTLPVSIVGIGTAVLYGEYYLIKLDIGKYKLIKKDKDAGN